jgi:N-acetylglucosamine-6-sulfatase
MRALSSRNRAWWIAVAILAVLVPGLVIVLTASTGRLDSDPNASPAPHQVTRPNVIVIQADDQTVEQLEAMPKLRHLIGGAGTTYDQYVASFPLCCPSRATLLTGQYSHNHGVEGNEPPYGGYGRLRQAETLPVWLSRAGYETGHVGKFLNGYGRRDQHEIPKGWADWVSAPYPYQHSYFGYDLNVNGRIVKHGVAAEDYVDDVYTQAALSFIARQRPAKKPFFLSLDYLAPHRGAPYGTKQRCDQYAKPAPRYAGHFAQAPLPQPPSFNEPDVSDKPTAIRTRHRLGPQAIADITENYQCRREALLTVDDGVEKVVQELDRLGELANTYVLYISDNSFFQGEHRIPLGKQRVYEADARVPFLLRGPGIGAGQRHDDLIANIDLAPTLLDLMGARAQVAGHFLLDGHSLVPQLTGRVPTDPAAGPDRALLLENGPGGAAIPQFDGIRTRRYVYVEYLDGDRELYDLERDPYELDSRHNDPAYVGVIATLAPALADLRSCAGPGCEKTVTVPAPALLPPIAHAAGQDRS